MESERSPNMLEALQSRSSDVCNSSPVGQAMLGCSESSITVDYCMTRVIAAEEALIEVRKALEKVSNLSLTIQPRSSFAGMTASREPSSQPSLINDLVKAVSYQSMSPHQFKEDSATDERTAPMDENGGCSSMSLSATPKGPVDELGGLEEVAKRFRIEPSDVEKCQRAFVGMDLGRTGKVSAIELDILLEKVCGMRFSTAEIQTIIAKFDKEHDGDLTFEEFLLFYCETPIHRVLDLNSCISKVSREIRAHMEEDRMSPNEIVDDVGIPAKVVRTYLRKELEEASACLQLPVAAFLLACFLVAVFWHMRIEELHAVDTAISQDLLENANFAFGGAVPFDNGRMGHKNLNDVNSFPDFWSWLSLGVVPLFWPDGSWGSSEARLNMAARCLSTEEALELYGWNRSVVQERNPFANLSCPEGRDPPLTPSQFWRANFTSYLYFHNILGGVRMSQQESIDQPCPNTDSELLDAVHPASCLSVPVGYWLRPEFATTLSHKSEARGNVRDVEPQYLLSRTPQPKIMERLRKLENEGWLNPRTARIEIMITTYNPHMDTLTATYLLFFLNRGGHIHKLIEPVSVWLTPYHGWWNYVADILWAFTITAIMLYECVDLASNVYEHGLRRGFREYINWSNAVDWLSIFYSFCIMILWCEHLQSMADVRELIRRADPEVVGSWIDENDRILFFEMVENIMIECHELRAVLAWYPFAVVSRLFKAFAYQPRLAMVTNTMKQASSELIHFGLVFGSIFVIYATSAMIVFGQELLTFATFGRAIGSTFRVLMGDFDWDEMAHVGRVRANIWFVSFMLLVNFIMLNMLLAIVMDVYTEVKGSMGADAETLWSQAYEIYIRFRETQFGEHMYLRHILKHVENENLDALQAYAWRMENEDSVEECTKFYTVGKLCEVIPGLPKDQAKNILIAAREMQESKERTASSLSDMGKTMATMNSTLWTLHEALQNVFHMDEMIARLLLNASEVAGRSLNTFGSPAASSSVGQASRQTMDAKDSLVSRGDAQDFAETLKDFAGTLTELREETRATHGLLHKQSAILHSLPNTLKSAPGTGCIESPPSARKMPPGTGGIEGLAKI